MIVQAARRERGKTIKQVAEEAGIDPAYLSRIERGKQSPSTEVLLKLTEVLDLTELHSALKLCDGGPAVDINALFEQCVRESTKDLSWKALFRLAREHGIPVPWTDPDAKTSPLPRIPPTLAQVIQECTSRSLKARARRAIYMRALLSYLKHPEAQNLLQNLIAAVCEDTQNQGMNAGIAEALKKLQEAATYALFWAVVSFLPPQKALVLHKLHTVLVDLEYRPEVVDGLLEIGRMLAELPPEKLEEIIPSLVSAVRNALPLLAGEPQPQGETASFPVRVPPPVHGTVPPGTGPLAGRISEDGSISFSELDFDPKRPRRR
jgi:transcriptional regulator with XRE-family HTH domain